MVVVDRYLLGQRAREPLYNGGIDQKRLLPCNVTQVLIDQSGEACIVIVCILFRLIQQIALEADC